MGFWGGGGMGGWSGMGGGLRSRRHAPRAPTAGTTSELGSVYNHAVTMRLFSYVKPYWRRRDPRRHRRRRRRRAAQLPARADLQRRERRPGRRRRTAYSVRCGLFLALVVFGWGFVLLQLLNAGYIGHRVLRELRIEMFAPSAEALAPLLRQQRGRPRHVARAERRDLDAGPADQRLPHRLRRHRRHRSSSSTWCRAATWSWRSSPSASCRSW